MSAIFINTESYTTTFISKIFVFIEVDPLGLSCLPHELCAGGLGVTQNAYFSLLTHTKQLLLVKFCDTPAGIEVSFRMGRRTADGRTDRHGSRNSYLDFYQEPENNASFLS